MARVVGRAELRSALRPEQPFKAEPSLSESGRLSTGSMSVFPRL